MKSGMDKNTGALITGVAYLRQRLYDVMSLKKCNLCGGHCAAIQLANFRFCDIVLHQLGRRDAR